MSQHQDPAAASSRARLRTVIAALLIAVSVVLAPVAVLGSWARTQLVDTDSFVHTFAPLAGDPAVQSFVTDQVTQAIDDNLDIDALVNDLIRDLPTRTRIAAGLLTGPAAEGVRSMIHSAVQRAVTSPRFAQVWELSRRESHSRAMAILTGDPNTAVQLSQGGVLSLELAPVIRQVKQMLIDQGFGLASRIPEIERSIPIVKADSLVQARSFYQFTVALGYWLPWIVLGLLIAGLATAPHRIRALAWAGGGLTVALLLLAAGLRVGRQFFIGSVAPSVMPSATAEALFDQATASIHPAVWALVVLSALVAVGAWLAGSSRPALAIRSVIPRRRRAH